MGSKGGALLQHHHFKQAHGDHREGELGEHTPALRARLLDK